MKITLDNLSPEHTHTLLAVLELAARIGMGQFGEIADFVDTIKDGDTTIWQRRESTEKALKEILMPELRQGYFAIHNKNVPQKSRCAWELYATIRQKLAWLREGNPSERNWSTMTGRDYDDPMPCSGLPLPSCIVENTL